MCNCNGTDPPSCVKFKPKSGIWYTEKKWWEDEFFCKTIGYDIFRKYIEQITSSPIMFYWGFPVSGTISQTSTNNIVETAPLKFVDEDNSPKKCTCAYYDVINFGCKCGGI